MARSFLSRLLIRQRGHLVRMHRASRHVPFPIRLIAAGKGAKGLGFLLLGLFVARLIHAPDLESTVEHLLSLVHIDPDGHRMRHLIDLFAATPLDRLTAIASGMFLYAALYLIEAGGLWFDRAWAEWLTLIGTLLLVPLEVRHLIHSPGFGIVFVLLLNLAVAAYIAYRLRCKQLLRRMDATDAARAAGTGHGT